MQVGGLMVYSTCSMNPIENEAVVCQLLREGGDSVELVDTTSMLPGLVSTCLLDVAPPFVMAHVA